MADKRNGNSGWEANPSHWNEETEIGVWDPSTASSARSTTEWSAATPNHNGNTASSARSTTEWSAATPSHNSNTVGMYNHGAAQVQQYPQNNALYSQGEGFGTWQSGPMNRENNTPYHPTQALYRHPHSNDRPAPVTVRQQGYTNEMPQTTSYAPPTSYEVYNPNSAPPYYDNRNTQQPSYQLSRASEAHVSGPLQSDVHNWSNSPPPPMFPCGEVRNTAPSRPYRNTDQPQETGQYSNPGTFRNPLMDEVTEKPETLIERLRLQEETTQKQLLNSSRVPAVLSKGALAMLGQELSHAAVAFKSAENLKRARDAQLGILDDGIGTEVVVSTLSVNAAEFVPSKVPEAIPELVPQPATEHDENLLIESLGNFIENVLLQPGFFDELIKILVTQIKKHLHSEKTVKKMVEMIFDKAINEDNFKYLGAKLCDKLTQENVLSNFRTIFLRHFQGKYKEMQGLIEKRDDDNRKMIHGFFMFMAEVFIHIKINGAPIKALGRSLSKSLGELLSSASTSDVQFVCKVLKLAGSRLLDAFAASTDDMKNYEKNFEALKEFSEKVQSKQDEGSKRVIILIKSVTMLKNSNWGRTVSSSRPKSSIEDPEQFGEDLSLVDQNYYMNEPVFFTPEGVQYTAAEAQIPDFYEQHLAKHNISQYIPTEEGDSYTWSNAEDTNEFIPSDEEFELYKEEDQEYSREFEKFLADSGQLM